MDICERHRDALQSSEMACPQGQKPVKCFAEGNSAPRYVCGASSGPDEGRYFVTQQMGARARSFHT